VFIDAQLLLATVPSTADGRRAHPEKCAAAQRLVSAADPPSLPAAGKINKPSTIKHTAIDSASIETGC
jgi:hypothetical protein